MGSIFIVSISSFILKVKKIKRTFALGDPHGGHRALVQVLELCNFNKETDQLIVLGDVVDGWPETVEVINELLTIKNLFPVMGNHDFWCYNWMRFGWRPELWTQQGGQATLDSYKYKGLEERPEKEFQKLLYRHREKYFNKCHAYYIDSNNNAYVHGGYSSISGLGDDSLDTYMWDRSLWNKAKSAKEVQLNMTKMYNKVFIGHTSMGFGSVPTRKGGNVINCDTGGGWEGALSLINVDTEEVFQSDLVKLLYPGIQGR